MSSSHDTQDIFVLSMNSTDLLRISPVNATLETAANAAIAQAWPRGLHWSQHKLGNKVAEFKLHGDPWSPAGFVVAEPQCAPLMLALLRGCSKAGFCVQTSVDMSRLSTDTHAIVLRRAPPVDLSAPGAMFGIWLVGADSMYAYEAPHELLADGPDGLEAIINKHWSRRVQSKKTENATCTHFKLKGKFLLCDGDEAIEARLFMANFLNDLHKRGFECFASIDACKSNICQDLMLFRRVSATPTPH